MQFIFLNLIVFAKSSLFPWSFSSFCLSVSLSLSLSLSLLLSHIFSSLSLSLARSLFLSFFLLWVCFCAQFVSVIEILGWISWIVPYRIDHEIIFFLYLSKHCRKYVSMPYIAVKLYSVYTIFLFLFIARINILHGRDEMLVRNFFYTSLICI